MNTTEALGTMAECAGNFAAEMIKAQGRAERAEAEADDLRETLDLAEGYIRAWADRGDEGARAGLRMIGERRG